jgi:hypothetical protein
LSAQKPQTDPRALMSSRGVLDLLDISQMTRNRWSRDPALAFPRHVAVVRGRRFYLKRDIEEFIDRLAEATASGEAATIAPLDPRRRRAAKDRAGGVVT